MSSERRPTEARHRQQMVLGRRYGKTAWTTWQAILRGLSAAGIDTPEMRRVFYREAFGVGMPEECRE